MKTQRLAMFLIPVMLSAPTRTKAPTAFTQLVGRPGALGNSYLPIVAELTTET